MIAAQGLTANQSLDDKKNFIVYSLFSIFTIIIIIIIINSRIGIISISISFVVLSQATSFTFCPFLLPVPLQGKGKGE